MRPSAQTPPAPILFRVFFAASAISVAPSMGLPQWERYYYTCNRSIAAHPQPQPSSWGRVLGFFNSADFVAGEEAGKLSADPR